MGLLLTLLLPFLAFVSGIEGYGHYRPVLPEGDARAAVSLDVSSLDDIAVCEAYLANQCGDMVADKVDSLPGQPEILEDSLDFDQYAGYVTVDPEAGRALFYYFTAAAGDKASTPLLLWFNGGGNWDAQSSLGRGAMMGQGPFIVNEDGLSLSWNKYSWNKVANIIFLESPVGVGYSYSNTTTDYNQIGDTKAVEDAFTFLINWFERFPQYKSRVFYIGGDGYAGHCVPQLAYTIHRNNMNCNRTSINLQGLFIGNGWMDEDIFLKGVYDYQFMHNLISDDIHEGITSNCNFSFPIVLSSSCGDCLNNAANLVADINPYDIYGPSCKSSSRNNISVGGFDSCSHLYVESYLNCADVQEALHANITALSHPWTLNSTVIKEWKNWYPRITPVIKDLMGNGIRIWLYSGDTDGVVPTTSTKYFIDSLQLPVEASSYPWYDNEGEVAGFSVGYENLTFVTVRGGGHFVPSYQPSHAFTLFSYFISGVSTPNSPK